MKKHFFIFLILFYSVNTFANMASPYLYGDKLSAPISSADISITHEKIKIDIDSNFNNVFFSIEYYINTEKDGNQIPLLFIAKQYKDDFNVWLDHIAVKTAKVDDSTMHKFSKNEFLNFALLDNKNQAININELIYFETSIPKGSHTIKVSYVAKASAFKDSWLKERFIEYSLLPAKFWKTYGGFDLVIDNSKLNKALEINLGKPISGSLDSIAYFHFNNLPADEIKISYKPKLSKISKFLINLDPVGIASIALFLSAIFHLLFLKSKRQNNTQKLYGWLVGGGIAACIITYIVFLYAYSLIDFTIGYDASGRHGYYFLAIIFLPFILVFYLLIVGLIDNINRRRIL